MELDDLKKAWKQEDKKPTKTTDIMELIHHKSKGPIAALKTAFRKQMFAVIALMSAFIATQANNVDSVSSNLLFWTYIGFCMAMFGGLYLNYQLTRKMERMDEKVKHNLEQHIAMLEQRLKWQKISARVVILFFILLLEVIPLYQHLRMLDTWHALSPIIRFSSYAAFLVFQYFLSRAITQKKFGKHLDHLKNLLQEVA
jgi:hypothetical protein